MINKIYNLRLDIKDIKPLKTHIKFTQGDTETNIINFSICEGNEKVDFTNIHNCTIAFLKPDNTQVISEVEIIDAPNGLLKYVLGTSEIAAVGEVISSIQFYGGESARLTSIQFIFTVDRDLYSDEAIESTSEFPILAKLLNVESSEQTRIDQENIRKLNEIERIQSYNANESRFTNIETYVSDNIDTINNVTIPNLKYYKWVKQATIPIGSNTINLTDYIEGQVLLIIDTTYGIYWTKPNHWTIAGSTITFTESNFQEAMTFQIYNLG